MKPKDKSTGGRYRFTKQDHEAGARALNNSLTRQQRTASARKAVLARWSKWCELHPESIQQGAVERHRASARKWYAKNRERERVRRAIKYAAKKAAEP